jgi:hypothetical protein
MSLRHASVALILPLAAWCLYSAIGLSSVSNWYELLVTFLTIVFPFQVLLALLALYARNEEATWVTKISTCGLVVAGVSFMIPLIIGTRDYYVYLVDRRNAAQYVQPSVLRDFKPTNQ